MSGKRSRQWLIVLTMLMIGYLGGYGLLRWRKLLVRQEFASAKGDVMVTRIAAGRDLRASGVGTFKNRTALIAAWLYAPLSGLEAELISTEK